MNSNSKEEAFRFSVFYNIWYPLGSDQCFESIADIMCLVILPTIVLWVVYYFIALESKMFRTSWKWNNWYPLLVGILQLLIILGLELWPDPFLLPVIAFAFALGLFIFCRFNRSKAWDGGFLEMFANCHDSSLLPSGRMHFSIHKLKCCGFCGMEMGDRRIK